MLFSSSVHLRPDGAHLVVCGELDMLTAPQVSRRIADALAGGSTDFTVDVADLTFVDAAGLSTFVRLRNATYAAEGSMRFVSASRHFRWVCDVAGLRSAFGLDPSEAAALC